MCVCVCFSIYMSSELNLHEHCTLPKEVISVSRKEKKNMCNKYTCGHLTLAVLVYLFVSGESHQNQIITAFTIVM